MGDNWFAKQISKLLSPQGVDESASEYLAAVIASGIEDDDVEEMAEAFFSFLQDAAPQVQLAATNLAPHFNRIMCRSS
jgi:hypothetical protein